VVRAVEAVAVPVDEEDDIAGSGCWGGWSWAAVQRTAPPGWPVGVAWGVSVLP